MGLVDPEESTPARTFHALIPVELRVPAGLEGIVQEVFSGEYECGYVGEDLRILDIGANMGVFSLWAAHRWPRSTIDAYEPNPGTFRLLEVNARAYPQIRCHQLAVYPSSSAEEVFFFRGAGDGQAGIVKELSDTFDAVTMGGGSRISVPLLHPRLLPAADLVKIDVEGAEAAIVMHGDFSNTSLVLAEFQYRRNLDAIKTALSPEFDVIFERRMPWSAILATDDYRPTLAGDEYGLVFLLRRGQRRFRKLALT